MKTYWPYLPMALIVGVGLACSSFWGSIHKDVLGYATNMSISALLQDTNTQRQGNSLAGLTLNDQLDQAAQAKANDMATRNYWSHNTPDGATPWTFIINAGYQYQTAGENLAYGFDSSDATLTAWMNSPEHKANILNNTYTDVGFGIANAPDYQGSGPETIVVAMYGSPAPSTNVSVPGTPAPTPIVSSTSPTPPSSTSPTSNTPTSTPTGNTPSSPASPTATGAIQRKSATTLPLASQNVSRLQLLSGGARWSAFAASTLAAVCLAAFLLRHGLALRRVFNRSEAFVLKHRYLDIAFILIAVASFVLTRSAGVIH